MKKTILATAITALFAATTVQAATVYEKDGTTVDVSGDIGIYAGNMISEDEGTLIAVDDADIALDLAYDIGHDLTAISTLSYTVGDENGVELDEAFVGISSATWGTVTAGKQVTVYDDAGIGNDYQFGWTDFYSQDDGGDQVIKYSLDTDMFYGAVAWLKNSSPEYAAGANGLDAKIGARVENLDVTLFFADFEDSDGNDITNINFEARYQLDALELAAAFSVSENNDVDQTAFGLAATYQLNDKVQFSGGVANIDNDAEDDAVIDYFVNASYAFTSNVETYIELGGSDADNTELGYAAGMIVSF